MKEHALAGKVAVITGASRGFGFSMAEALGAAGAAIALVSRDLPRLTDAAQRLRAQGIEAEPFPADVGNESAVTLMAEGVLSRFGQAHILINNAGINLRKSVTDFTLSEWREIIDTNLTGAFLVTRAFVPAMRSLAYGRVINLTSMLSHVALAHRTAYCSSKFGLLGFTKALALELAPDQITVNAISPGPFATDINQQLLDSPELSAWFLSRIPLGRWGAPKDIGSLACFLCSEDAGFITGADIVIDGGWTAQ